MRIQRNMLLKLADDTVTRIVTSDRTVLAAYLQGSLLGDSPLIGNTADIDLFFIHTDEVAVEREIVRLSDEVHLDISHHSHRIYRQPRELRLHPWLGPAIYGCKIMYDPQHFIDFTQASVRGQFNAPQNVISRVRKQAEHSRQMWESLSERSGPPGAEEVRLYLRVLERRTSSGRIKRAKPDRTALFNGATPESRRSAAAGIDARVAGLAGGDGGSNGRGAVMAGGVGESIFRPASRGNPNPPASAPVSVLCQGHR